MKYYHENDLFDFSDVLHYRVIYIFTLMLVKIGFHDYGRYSIKLLNKM